MRRGIPERLCGRPFSLNDIQAIQEEVQGGYCLSKMEIARRVCNRLNWGNSLGQPQLMSCRVGLLRLHRLGLIELPPPFKEEWKRQRGLVRQKTKLPQLSFLEADLQSLRGLRLDRVRTREKGLRLIVNNSRFLVLPNIRVKNLASRVLSLCAERIRVDFSETYGYEPVLFETFVENGRYSGTCYRATMNEWVTGELATVNFSDKRLDKRMRNILDRKQAQRE